MLLPLIQQRSKIVKPNLQISPDNEEVKEQAQGHTANQGRN